MFSAFEEKLFIEVEVALSPSLSSICFLPFLPFKQFLSTLFLTVFKDICIVIPDAVVFYVRHVPFQSPCDEFWAIQSL